MLTKKEGIEQNERRKPHTHTGKNRNQNTKYKRLNYKHSSYCLLGPHMDSQNQNYKKKKKGGSTVADTHHKNYNNKINSVSLFVSSTHSIHFNLFFFFYVLPLTLVNTLI